MGKTRKRNHRSTENLKSISDSLIDGEQKSHTCLIVIKSPAKISCSSSSNMSLRSSVMKLGAKRRIHVKERRKLQERFEKMYPERKLRSADKDFPLKDDEVTVIKAPPTNNDFSSLTTKRKHRDSAWDDKIYYCGGEDQTLIPSKKHKRTNLSVGCENKDIPSIDLTDSPNPKSPLTIKDRRLSTSTPLIKVMASQRKDKSSLSQLDLSAVRCSSPETPKRAVSVEIIEIEDDTLVASPLKKDRIETNNNVLSPPKRLTLSAITSGEFVTIDNTCNRDTVLSQEEEIVHMVKRCASETLITSRKPLDPVRIAEGIMKLSTPQKSNLLDLIARNMLGSCFRTVKLEHKTRVSSEIMQPKLVPSKEDIYIKEVILNESGHNRYGSNIYNPDENRAKKTGLRMVVIDGSNVAIGHGNGFFSVRGLQICIDYFLRRGHVVKAFVPRFRCKRGRSSNPKLLADLEQTGHVVFTPSREIQGRNVVSYDDRYIVQCAAEFEGVIVSADNFRDLLDENPSWRLTIESRLLQFTWVADMIMFPRDPLGKDGPSLEVFLKHATDINPLHASEDIL